MAALIFLLLNLGASLFKSRCRLEAENAALRQQLIVLQRKVRGRVEFTNSDRLFFIQLYRWFPSILKAITTFRPETLVRWHRAGFRRYWRWKSRNLGGRPQIAVDLRALIRRMSVENLLWGAPRIHGELLKLGFAVAQSTVAKYMAGKAGPSGQRWSTFLRNHSSRRCDSNGAPHPISCATTSAPTACWGEKRCYTSPKAVVGTSEIRRAPRANPFICLQLQHHQKCERRQVFDLAALFGCGGSQPP
jgi:hypothetical protein